MAAVKEMSDEVKYARVTDNMKFDEAFILPFIQENLGDEAVSELKELWQKGFSPIEEGASFKSKYETAYGNWIWLAKNIYPFVRERLGDEGMDKFERAEVEGLLKKNASPALFVLKVMRALAPTTAFSMTAKQMGYEFQWLTPFSTDLTREKLVLNIPQCKILDFEGTEDICVVGCQSTYPMWVAEQFNVDMRFDRQGHSCTGVITPLG